MRFAAGFLAMWLVGGIASADVVLSNNLSTNDNGQVTARFGSANAGFDVLIDVLNADGSSRCSPGAPCYSPGSTTSLTSKMFGAGEFAVSFQAVMGIGPPIRIASAGLNHQLGPGNSFFDVYFEVDLGGGNFTEAALGLHAAGNSSQMPVTGEPAISWGTCTSSFCPGVTDVGQATFFLDPMAFDIFDLTLNTNPFLGGPPPPLDPNPNVVPEPHHMWLLGALTAILFVWHRRRSLPAE